MFKHNGAMYIAKHIACNIQTKKALTLARLVLLLIMVF